MTAERLSTHSWKPTLVREAIVVGGLVAIAMVVAVRYVATFRSGGERPAFYQEMFAPAVMQACGKGFINVAERTIPVARDVSRDDDRLVRLSGRASEIVSIPQTPMQDVHRYLLMAAAACWRVLGVRWSALDWLTGGLFASTTVALYLACRVVAGTTVSAVLSALAIVSPLQLANLPHIRDYSRRPFLSPPRSHSRGS